MNGSSLAWLVFGSGILVGCNAILGIDEGKLDPNAGDGGSNVDGTVDAAFDSAIDPDAGADATSEGTNDSGAPDYAAMETIHPSTNSFTFHVRSSRDRGEKDITATLSHPFQIDRYEVVVERVRAWAEEQRPRPPDGTSLDPGGPYEHSLVWDGGWDSFVGEATFLNDSGCDGPVAYYPPTFWSERGGLPMTCINWYQAVAFCYWEGQKRLPTELEWVYLATAGGTRPVYSFAWDGHSLVSCQQATVAGCQFPAPVGSASNGQSSDHLYDLTGSVFEWTWDWVDEIPNTITNYTGPSNPPGDPLRVVRGGAYILSPDSDELRNEYRREFYGPTDFYLDLGFRCAKSLSE